MSVNLTKGAAVAGATLTWSDPIDGHAVSERITVADPAGPYWAMVGIEHAARARAIDVANERRVCVSIDHHLPPAPGFVRFTTYASG